MNACMTRDYVHRVDWLHEETDNHTTQLSPTSMWGLGRPTVV